MRKAALVMVAITAAIAAFVRWIEQPEPADDDWPYTWLDANSLG